MNKTIFHISKMDCPSEERIIRLKLDQDKRIQKLDFDLQSRILTIFHEGDPQYFLDLFAPLNFGTKIQNTQVISNESFVPDNIDHEKDAKVLKLLLAINGGMFIVELVTGFLADSMGLISDSLDMLADSGVYLVSLYAVGKTLQIKKRSARLNGSFQMILGLIVLTETIRRFIYGSHPEPSYMILISLVALAANAYCLMLLTEHKEGEIHMKASYICSSTDVMANMGVVLAGISVFLTKSPYPDLVIGLIMTGIVLRGSLTLLKLAK